MWFKNLRVFRLLPTWSLSAQELEDALSPHAFAKEQENKSAMQRLGWVPVRDDRGLVYAQDGQYLIALRSEKKLLPASVINQFAQDKAQAMEEQQGYKPGKRQMKEIKEQVTDELLPRAFSLYRDTRVWIDTKNHWLVVDAGSSAKSDEVLGLLAKALEPFPVEPLLVQQSPAACMTSWLVDAEPIEGFSIDQDAELASTQTGGGKIRYVRESVALDDAQKHIQEGKQCTRLAMTWNDRVSFVLTDSFDIKRITPLDVLQGEANTAQNEAEQFDADFALMTGEINGLLANLVQVLGGERVEQQSKSSASSGAELQAA